MHLYHLSLSRPGSVTCAASGNFTGSKQGANSELAVARGDAIAILRPDAMGRMVTVAHRECFATVRSLASFRLTKQPKDYLAVGSDSGRMTVLEYDAKRGALVAVHSETFGKSGVRRVVPGQYVCADPKGRALMVAAVEKQKFVYVMNRDSGDALTISSPLEAHKSHTLCVDLIALDCDFDNPVFAAIEVAYADADADPSGEAAAAAQKHLTLYELDLGLNHVVRKWSGAVDNGAHKLIQVPGGAEGPGGCIVCCENFVLYRNGGDAPELRVVVPRRQSLPASRGVLIVSATRHKQKSGFFFLLQSEYGDLYKLTLAYDAGTGAVTDMRLKYFDTIAPAVSLNMIIIRKTGFLFAASEFGNHALCQFLSLGDESEGVECAASAPGEAADGGGYAPVYLAPRPLANLAPVDLVESLSPVVDMKVANLCGEETPQIFAACGAGSRSSVRMLRLGLTVTVMAQSPLPGSPSRVWTVKRRAADAVDSYIVVSFANATLVLGVGETVEEVADSGLLGTAPSMHVGLMGDDSMVQVHPAGFRYIQPGKPVVDWRPPGRRTVNRVAANSRQLVLALSGGEIMYFELDDMMQLAERERKEVSGEVACLAVAAVPRDRQRARFLAVGGFDNTVRILSLDPTDLLQVLTVQALAAPPESMLFLDSGASLSLAIGLSNGVLLRSEMDAVTGDLADTRTRFLGARAPQLFELAVGGGPALLALSTRAWLGHTDGGSFKLAPVSYEPLAYAASFASEQCVDGGIVAVAGKSLHVIALERLDNPLNQASVRLRYTPRRVAVCEDVGLVVVAESERGARSVDARAHEQTVTAAAVESQDEAYGIQKAADRDEWACCLHVINPATSTAASVLEIGKGREAATCLCYAAFEGEERPAVVLGTAEGLVLSPVRCAGGRVRVYSLSPEGKLAERHTTAVGGMPSAVCGFRGMLLVGVGRSVALYQMGKTQLLKKAEVAGLPNLVQSISTNGNRIFVADSQESVHFIKYRHASKSMYIFADDSVPRHVSCSANLDYDTVAGGDKFGTFFVLRLPSEISDEVEADPTGGRHVLAEGKLNGAPNKLEAVCQFFVGSAITSLQRTVIQPGGIEVLLYSTITGALGVFVPFTTREDVDFFQHLEMFMRQESPSVCGRDHLSYRSSFVPVKETVDGDLCEEFGLLPADVQRRIAEGLDYTPEQIVKKLEDLRSVAF